MARYTRYNINVLKFVSDLRRTGVSSKILISSTNKTDYHNIAEIWLKVALNMHKPKS